MNNGRIVIGEPTARALRELLRTRENARHDQEHLDDLRAELERAIVMEPHELAPTVVTMNAVVEVEELPGGRRRQLTLVGPAEADVAAGRISVLAPLGTALLGYREGDVIEARLPGGARRVRVVAVRQRSTPATSAH